MNVPVDYPISNQPFSLMRVKTIHCIPNYNHLPTPNFLVTLQRQVGGTASRCARTCGETPCENVQRDAAPPTTVKTD